jgi:hypothetical protein
MSAVGARYDGLAEWYDEVMCDRGNRDRLASLKDSLRTWTPEADACRGGFGGRGVLSRWAGSYPCPEPGRHECGRQFLGSSGRVGRRHRDLASTG